MHLFAFVYRIIFIQLIYLLRFVTIHDSQDSLSLILFFAHLTINCKALKPIGLLPEYDNASISITGRKSLIKSPIRPNQ